MTRLQDITVMRLLIALTVALSLALSPVAARPAHADETTDLIAGLIALGLIGAAISNSNKSGGNVTIQPHPRRDFRKRLPSQCLTQLKTRFGKEPFFTKSCLRKNFRGWRKLPDQCELKVRVRNRDHQRVIRKVYEPRCLIDQGYRIARRR